jgi:hypothetical protein
MPISARYMDAMAKAHEEATEKVVRDSKSGRSVVVRGAGALKGHLTLKKDVDLTKPIASQTMKESKARKAEPAHTWQST